tara:strand:- start:5162 stop:6511 length:1350 start_codon:yes stop_codon:yes gene_type:complete
MSDTIVALATPAGDSALATIRISGLLSEGFTRDALSLPYPSPRHSYLTNYKSNDAEVIDQVICCYYEQNKSFTNEKMLEISCHGNPIIVQKILSDLVCRGARIAEPGEFTKRAYLNGKIDLVQAEAIAEMISAKSLHAIKLARKNLNGNLSSIISRVQTGILKVRAKLEAFVDFPEDDIGSENYSKIISEVTDIQLITESLIDSSNRRSILDKNLRVILVGAPNAGKSTLFNCLVGFDRSIVSDIPGTTRDYVSKSLIFDDLEIELIDTAGLRETSDQLESLGVDNTVELIEQADMVIAVIDSSLPYPSELNGLLSHSIASENFVIVENKSDLKKHNNSEKYPHNAGVITISAKNKVGIRDLVEKIKEVNGFGKENTALEFSVNLRHKKSLEEVNAHLLNATSLLKDQQDDLIILSILKQASQSLGDIVKPTDNEEMLDHLFKNFCIGK